MSKQVSRNVGYFDNSCKSMRHPGPYVFVESVNEIVLYTPAALMRHEFARIRIGKDLFALPLLTGSLSRSERPSAADA